MEPTDAENAEAQRGTQQVVDHREVDQVTTSVEATNTANVKKTRGSRGERVSRPRKEVTSNAPASEPSSAQSMSVRTQSSEGQAME